MEAVVGAVLEEEGLVAIGHLVVVVAQFVMDGDKVVGGGLEAGLDAHVALVVDVPCAGMADHFAVARMGEHGALPEGVGQRVEAQRLVEALAVADQLLRVCVARLEDGAQVVGQRSGGRRDHVVDVAPLLRPHISK